MSEKKRGEGRGRGRVFFFPRWSEENEIAFLLFFSLSFLLFSLFLSFSFEDDVNASSLTLSCKQN